MGYERAAHFARQAAESDSVGFLRRLAFVPKGRRIGEPEAAAPPDPGRPSKPAS
jgi:hypothetical protein